MKMKEYTTDELLVLGMALYADKTTMEKRIRGIFGIKYTKLRYLVFLAVIFVLVLAACFTTACVPRVVEKEDASIKAEMADVNDPAVEKEIMSMEENPALQEQDDTTIQEDVPSAEDMDGGNSAGKVAAYDVERTSVTIPVSDVPVSGSTENGTECSETEYQQYVQAFYEMYPAQTELFSGEEERDFYEFSKDFLCYSFEKTMGISLMVINDVGENVTEEMLDSVVKPGMAVHFAKEGWQEVICIYLGNDVFARPTIHVNNLRYMPSYSLFEAYDSCTLLRLYHT